MSDNFSHLLWLGGSPCSGKTSVSEMLAAQLDLEVYYVDRAFESHRQRLEPNRHPTLSRWLRMSWDERWMQPVEQLVQDAIACYREHFSLVLEDLIALPAGRLMLVEGTALLPCLVAQLGVRRNRALWMVPEAEFQRAQYANRDWVRPIMDECREPQAAFGNWMERDARFAAWVVDEAARLGFEVLIVDGRHTIQENARRVAAHFGI